MVVMTKKRTAQPVVLHVREAMSIGGAERLILNLFARRELGAYDLRLASFVRTRDGAGEEFIREAAATGVPTEKIKLSRRWDFGNIWALWKVVRRHDARLLHTHGYRSDMVGAIVSVLTGVPMVASAHGFTAADANVVRNEKIGRFFLRAARKIICVSDNVRETLIRSGVPEGKLVMIPNAVDFEHFRSWTGDNLRKNWKVGSDDIIIGSAGRLSPEKAHVNLVRACGQLPSEIKGRIHIAIAGDGPERDAISQEAEATGFGQRLILAGFQSDMRPFYGAIDIFCLPSLTEGLPLVLLEACASSRPVVASRVGSVGELINDGEDGFCPDAGDIGRLTQALKQLAETPKLRSDFAAKLIAKLSDQYDVQPWVRKVFAVYNQILN
jgi:glycosyltransferase involved in cell wall biosynthesis